ncbi:hypothetical protein [Neobacillus sp. Marseille-QA0830]
MEETESPLQDKQEEAFVPEESNDAEGHHRIDPFTALMFGQQRYSQPHFELFPDSHPSQNPPPNQQGIDLDLLLYHIDTLVESVKGFKPLLDKAYPYVQKYILKK